MKVYKYMSSSDYTVDSIRKGFLKLSGLSAYNDDYEFIPVVGSSEIEPDATVLARKLFRIGYYQQMLLDRNDGLYDALMMIYINNSESNLKSLLRGEQVSINFPLVLFDEWASRKGSKFNQICEASIQLDDIEAKGMECLLQEVFDILKSINSASEQSIMKTLAEISSYYMFTVKNSIDKFEKDDHIKACRCYLSNKIISKYKDSSLELTPMEAFNFMMATANLHEYQWEDMLTDEIKDIIYNDKSNALINNSFKIIMSHFGVDVVNSMHFDREIARSLFDTGFSFLCLSDTKDNQQLWQEYASNSSGLMLEFESYEMFDEFSVSANVNYVEKFDPNIGHRNLTINDNSISDFDKSFIPRMLTKFESGTNNTLRKRSEWKNESEFRFIFRKNSEQIIRVNGLEFAKFNPGSLKSITFGVNSTPEFINEITKAIAYLGIDCEINHACNLTEQNHISYFKYEDGNCP